jgi:hypothetical protein
LTDFARDLNVNTTSAFVAAQQAVTSFENLSSSDSRTFIYTGNILNHGPLAAFPTLLDLGVGKSATAHIIQAASNAYKDQGFKYVRLLCFLGTVWKRNVYLLTVTRFYYADERKADGSAAFAIDGEAHAKIFTQLAEGTAQGPWEQTFVKGVGYKNFAASNL